MFGNWLYEIYCCLFLDEYSHYKYILRLRLFVYESMDFNWNNVWMLFRKSEMANTNISFSCYLNYFYNNFEIWMNQNYGVKYTLNKDKRNLKVS